MSSTIGSSLDLELYTEDGTQVIESHIEHQSDEADTVMWWQLDLYHFKVDSIYGVFPWNYPPVQNSREWLEVKGKYKRSGGTGGTGATPTFWADVVAADLDVAHGGGDEVDETEEESQGAYFQACTNIPATLTLRNLQYKDGISGSKRVELHKIQASSDVHVYSNQALTCEVTSWPVLLTHGELYNNPRYFYVTSDEPSGSARDIEFEARSFTLDTGGYASDRVRLTVFRVDLKVTHPQNPGPTGSAARYNNTPNAGSADNLFATWLNEQFRVNVNIESEALANNLPAGFIKWTAAGFIIPDNTTEYTFSWVSTGVKEITVEIPSCGITKKIRVDVPDVGILSQTAAAALVGAPSVFVLAYAQEAINYSNTNFPVGPQRDAFRHAYWMSLSVSQFGVAQWEALLISTGHEHGNRDDDHQQAFNSTMDLHNNSIGSGITYTTLLGTPDRTPIQNDITQQYTNGGLWIWAGGGAQENSEGILVKSNGSKIYSD